MKTRLVLLSLIVVLLASCDVIVVESRYDERDRVTGSYRIEEYSQTYNMYSNFRFSIRPAGYGQQDVLIDNFYNADITVRGEVSANKIYIPLQLVDGYEIEGVGTIYSNQIEWSYQVRDTYERYQPVDFCEATAWFN